MYGKQFDTILSVIKKNEIETVQGHNCQHSKLLPLAAVLFNLVLMLLC